MERDISSSVAAFAKKGDEVASIAARQVAFPVSVMGRVRGVAKRGCYGLLNVRSRRVQGAVRNRHGGRFEGDRCLIALRSSTDRDVA